MSEPTPPAAQAPLQPCVCRDVTHTAEQRQQYWQALQAANLQLSHFQQYYCRQNLGMPWWETDLCFVITDEAWAAMTACLLDPVPQAPATAGQQQEVVLQNEVLLPFTTSESTPQGQPLLEVTSLGRLAKYTQAQQVAQQVAEDLRQAEQTVEAMGRLGITETGVLRSLAVAPPGRLSAPYLNLPNNNVALSYRTVPQFSGGLFESVYASMADPQYQRLYFSLLFSGTLGAACESSRTPYFDSAYALSTSVRVAHPTLWPLIKVVDYASVEQPLFPISLLHLPQDIVLNLAGDRRRVFSSQLPAAPMQQLCRDVPIRCRTYCVQYCDQCTAEDMCDVVDTVDDAIANLRQRTCASFYPLAPALLGPPAKLVQIHNECVGFFLAYVHDPQQTSICSGTSFQPGTKHLLQLEQTSVTPGGVPWQVFSDFSFMPGDVFTPGAPGEYNRAHYAGSTLLVAAPLLTRDNQYPLCSALGDATHPTCTQCGTVNHCTPPPDCPFETGSPFDPCANLCDDVHMFVVLYNAKSLNQQENTAGCNKQVHANHILVRLDPTKQLGLRVNDKLANAAASGDVLFLLPLATMQTQLATSTSSNPSGLTNLNYEALPVPPPTFEEILHTTNISFTNVANGASVQLTVSNFSFTKEELSRIRLLRSTTDPITGRMQGQLFLDSTSVA
jgi:hypothetical protein